MKALTYFVNIEVSIGLIKILEVAAGSDHERLVDMSHFVCPEPLVVEPRRRGEINARYRVAQLGHLFFRSSRGKKS